MAVVANYSHQIFSDLVGPKVQHLKQKEVTDLSMLRDVFHEYDMEHLCGLALLHRHYSIAEDEIVVEKITTEKSESTPIKMTSLLPNVVPHLWRFHHGTWYPTEFLNIDDGNEKKVLKVYLPMCCF
jgi:hypothetical protein